MGLELVPRLVHRCTELRGPALEVGQGAVEHDLRLGQQLQLLGMDSGRSPEPETVDELLLAPGNRADLLVTAAAGDFFAAAFLGAAAARFAGAFFFAVAISILSKDY